MSQCLADAGTHREDEAISPLSLSFGQKVPGAARMSLFLLCKELS